LKDAYSREREMEKLNSSDKDKLWNTAVAPSQRSEDGGMARLVIRKRITSEESTAVLVC
jgi:hypothetical protein